jgi:hypothetical protein
LALREGIASNRKTEPAIEYAARSFCPESICLAAKNELTTLQALEGSFNLAVIGTLEAANESFMFEEV